MKQATLSKLTVGKYVTGGGIVAGLMTSTTAHASLVIQNPEVNIFPTNTVYFDLDSPTLSPNPTDGGSHTYGFSAGSGKTLEAFSAANAGITLNPVASGSIIDGSLTYGNDSAQTVPAPKGGSQTSIYGAEINTDGTPNYGYIEVTAGIADYTLDSYAYDTTPGEGVIAPVPVPEASNVGLMAVATLGAAGLIAYRRRRELATVRA